MASTNKTKHVGLPQWEASDKPERSDFNTAFAAVDTALSNKANLTTELSWFNCTIAEGFEHGSDPLKYAKDNAGLVHLNGTVTCLTRPLPNSIIGYLPKGFWPGIALCFPCTAHRGTTTSNAWCAYYWIDPNGDIRFTGGTIAEAYGNKAGICFSAVYISAQ